MDEQEWLVCKSPDQMITFLLKRKISDRKWRLFACSWFHEKDRFESVYAKFFPEKESVESVQNIVEVGERLADGLALPHEVNQVRSYARNTNSLVLVTISNDIARVIRVVFLNDLVFSEKDRNDIAHLLREIIGNPFRPVSFDSNWRTQKVLALANMIYDQKAYDLMPILADELEDAGCANLELLSHCRGGGPHVRGCWAVDLVLDKQ